jgi:transposase-like protein
MNLLTVSLQQSIQTLAARGWSARRIARELDINRETVGRWLRLAQPAVTAPVVTATPTAPEPGTPEPKPATVATGSGSRCEPWREHTGQALAQGLSAMRIYQDLVGDQLSPAGTTR